MANEYRTTQIVGRIGIEPTPEILVSSLSARIGIDPPKDVLVSQLVLRVGILLVPNRSYGEVIQ